MTLNLDGWSYNLHENNLIQNSYLYNETFDKIKQEKRIIKKTNFDKHIYRLKQVDTYPRMFQ